MTRLMDWGASMYGGYYATVVKEESNRDQIIGLHDKKLKGLKAQLAEYGLKVLVNKRRDN